MLMCTFIVYVVEECVIVEWNRAEWRCGVLCCHIISGMELSRVE